MKSKLIGMLIGAAMAWTVAMAATFPLFGPVNGVLKGNANSPQTSAAVSSDIRAMWSGTCDNTTYLRGDGSCQAPPGTGGGTVNSVGLTAPSVFSVGGSPVTTTGTLALTFATGQTQNQVLASPDGSSGAVGLRSLVAADLPLIDLTSGVSGILPGANGGTGNGFTAFSGPASTLKTFALPNASATILTTNAAVTVAQGGTGATTLTGPLKGNGTSAFSAAAAADIVGLWSGTCNGSTVLAGDGSCIASTSVSGANPSATIGLTAVNGAATTYLRSDGAPALSQSISPTWTGTHTFSVSPVVTVASGAQSFSLTASDGLSGSTSRINLSAGTSFALYSAPSTQSSAIVTNGPTGAQGVMRTLGAQPIIFGTNNTYWGQIDSAGHFLWEGPYAELLSTAPSIYMVESDASATNQAWLIQADAEAWKVRACTAVGSGCTNFITVDRTGNVVDSIDLAATAVTVNGAAIPTTDSGSFTGTLTGFTTTVTGTVRYHIVDTKVTLYLTSQISGTSNATTMTMTGLPAAVRPVNACSVIVTSMLDTGTPNFGNADIASSGSTITFALPNGTKGNTSTSGFTNSGTKGLTATWQMTYDVES